MWHFSPKWELSCNKVCTCHVKLDFGPLHRTLNSEVLIDSLQLKTHESLSRYRIELVVGSAGTPGPS